MGSWVFVIVYMSEVLCQMEELAFYCRDMDFHRAERACLVCDVALAESALTI